MALMPGMAVTGGTTQRVSVTSAELEATGGDSTDVAVSDDGRFVAFQSAAVDLVGGDSNGKIDIFVRDRLDGTTERVSVDSSEAQALNGDSVEPAISADGRFVAFSSNANNLVSGDTNDADDIFVRDRTNGTTERVSVSSSEAQATGGGTHCGHQRRCRYVVAVRVATTGRRAALHVFMPYGRYHRADKPE
jgi:Tol biopolymer transport system component